MSTYTLQRTLPNGQVKEQANLLSKRRAATAAFYVLTDNGATDARSATAVARELEYAPIGAEVAAYGYTFRLVES